MSDEASTEAAGVPRDAHADVLRILGDVAGGVQNLDRNHAKALAHAIKAGSVQVTGSYTSVPS